MDDQKQRGAPQPTPRPSEGSVTTAGLRMHPIANAVAPVCCALYVPWTPPNCGARSASYAAEKSTDGRPA